MTTTPLPPLPPEDFVWFDPEYGDTPLAYSATAVQAYATQARADLEAENARLREALTATADALALAQTDVHWELNSPTRKALRKSELAARATMEATK